MSLDSLDGSGAAEGVVGHVIVGIEAAQVPGLQHVLIPGLQ